MSAKRCNEGVSASHVTAGALLRQARQGGRSNAGRVPARVGMKHRVVSVYKGGGHEPSLATLSSPVEACGVTLEVHLGDELPTRGRPGPVGPVGRRLSRCRAALLAMAACRA